MWAKDKIDRIMIQTQLLKCEKPFQIISAAGMVGIQVATLIVTEDKVDEDGKYLIDTHSHPVVNYGNKEGLAEELKYRDGNPDYEYKYSQRLQPEGAVWNRVEVRDVQVLGLVGAKNIPVDLEKFIDLVPSLGCDPTEHLWDKKTVSKIYSLRYDLERAGLTFNLSNVGTWSNDYFNKEIHLQPELDDDFNPVVKVWYRSGGTNDDEGVYYLTSPIFFNYSLSEDAKEDAGEIWRILRILERTFKLDITIRFVYKEPDPAAEIDLKWVELVNVLTEELNKRRDEKLKGGI